MSRENEPIAMQDDGNPRDDFAQHITDVKARWDYPQRDVFSRIWPLSVLYDGRDYLPLKVTFSLSTLGVPVPAY